MVRESKDKTKKIDESEEVESKKRGIPYDLCFVALPDEQRQQEALKCPTKDGDQNIYKVNKSKII